MHDLIREKGAFAWQLQLGTDMGNLSDHRELLVRPGQLLKIEDESYENEAIAVLDKANSQTGSYQFKMRIGDIRIRQMTRRYRKLEKSGDKKAAVQQARMQLAFELEEYIERAANYPTDLAVKYELGRRQYLAGEFAP